MYLNEYHLNLMQKPKKKPKNCKATWKKFVFSCLPRFSDLIPASLAQSTGIHVLVKVLHLIFEMKLLFVTYFVFNLFFFVSGYILYFWALAFFLNNTITYYGWCCCHFWKRWRASVFSWSKLTLVRIILAPMRNEYRIYAKTEVERTGIIRIMSGDLGKLRKLR